MFSRKLQKKQKSQRIQVMQNKIPSMFNSHILSPLTVLFQLFYNDLRQTTTKNDFKYQHSKFNLVPFVSVLNMKTVFGVAAAGITLLTVREILTRWSTYDQLVTCFQGCVLPAGSRLIEVGQGCVCFTIQVDNLMGLTALWNMYEDGTLKERLFDFFVTDEMKTRAGGEENVELTVTIEKEEYEKAYFELVQEADGE